MRKQLEIAPLMNDRVFCIKENHGEIAFDKQFSCAWTVRKFCTVQIRMAAQAYDRDTYVNGLCFQVKMRTNHIKHWPSIKNCPTKSEVKSNCTQNWHHFI